MLENMFNGYLADKDIFYDELNAIDFLKRCGRLLDVNVCCFCQQDAMKIYKSSRCTSGYKLRCNNCSKSSTITRFINPLLPKIPLSKFLHVSFFFIYKMKNDHIVEILDISEHSYITIKSVLTVSASRFSDLDLRIGGPGHTIQIDETACCRRRLIHNPTSLATEIRGTKWVVGIFSETTKQIRMEVLENRSIQSLAQFIDKYILPGTIIKSDGYPSYPEAVRRSGCEHIIVNHNRGFLNENGDHTNSIESVWSSLKIEIRNRRGVMFHKLSEYINEYQLMKENNIDLRFRRVNRKRLFFNLIKYI